MNILKVTFSRITLYQDTKFTNTWGIEVYNFRLVVPFP